MRLAAAALVAGLLYLVVALTGLGATALAHAAPKAINLAGHAAPSGPPITAAAAPTATPPSAVQVPREVSVGRPVQVVSAALGPATAGPAAPNTDTNPLLAETLASPAPTSTGGESLLPGVGYLLTPALPDVTATTLPSPLPVPTPTTPAPTPTPSPTNPGLLGGLLGGH